VEQYQAASPEGVPHEEDQEPALDRNAEPGTSREEGGTDADQSSEGNGRTTGVVVSGTKAASKQQLLAALLVRDEGATLDQMIEATGWLRHTTRAALTGLKKKS
jgi:hypothetical protein